MENTMENFAFTIINAIGIKTDTLPEPASAHEAFALIREKSETADGLANVKKCIDHLWAAVKEKNEDAVCAYASQLASDARIAAVAYAELSAYAAKAAER